MSVSTSGAVYPTATSRPAINHVVSIGTFCFVAQAIKDAGLRRYSVPFDWIFSGSGMLRAILLDDFAEFLDRSLYVNSGGGPKNWTLPRYRQMYGAFGILNHHDVTNDAEFASLERAVKRMQALLRSDDTKLFVHMGALDHFDHPHYQELIDTIRATTTNAHFLTVGFRDRADIATFELISETSDTRLFAFTPTSDFHEGLRFSEPSDNLLLRKVFDDYEFDLFEEATQRQPAPDIASRHARLIPPADAIVYDIQHASTLLSRVELHRVVEESHADRPDPAFLYGTCAPERLDHFRNDQYLPPVLVSRISRSTLVGPFFMTGALIHSGGTYLSIPAISSDPKSDASRDRLAQMNERLAKGEAKYRKIDGEVLLLACNGHQIYGHWLVDFLPKLALLSEVGVSVDKIRVLLPTNMGQFGAALLDLVGIREEQIIRHDPETEILEIDSLLVPSTLRWGGRCTPTFTKAAAFLNSRIHDADLPKGDYPSRIFISRSLGGPHGRALIGEHNLIAEAARYGFKAVAPETMPLRTQVALLRQATHIIGPYGSGLHGSLFNTQQSLVCGFHGPTSFDALQSGIGERVGQPTGYIFGVPTPTPDDINANTVDVADFRQFLAEQIG